MLTVTKYFVNRTSEIERLNSALNSQGPEKELLVLMYGQQGIGKTQLLAKYLRLGNFNNLRIAYVDLHDRDYLGLISEIVRDLGRLALRIWTGPIMLSLLNPGLESSKQL